MGIFQTPLAVNPCLNASLCNLAIAKSESLPFRPCKPHGALYDLAFREFGIVISSRMDRILQPGLLPGGCAGCSAPAEVAS